MKLNSEDMDKKESNKDDSKSMLEDTQDGSEKLQKKLFIFQNASLVIIFIFPSNHFFFIVKYAVMVITLNS